MEMFGRIRNEYGGFLPLELNQGRELLAKYEKMMLRFNSVKASLTYLIERIECRRIYVPYYYCPSTAEAIKKIEIEVVFYHVDEKLMPVDILDEAGFCVLLVDYFGVRTEQISMLARSFQYAEVIIDRAHAFYATPIFDRHIHNVYSARKFFGVPDGSYLVSMNIVPSMQISTNAYEYAGYLVLAYEEGTNAAYLMKKDADQVIANNHGCMSKLAIGLMQNVDYGYVAKRRKKNYRILHNAFKDINGLELPEECIAYQYPLLIQKKGNSVKKRLIADKIFVSTLWAGEELMKEGNVFELDMSKHCIFLPIDQRYDDMDMTYIVGKVRKLIDEDS